MAQSKSKSETSPDLVGVDVEVETQDEIEQIMNEIEELQHGMTAATEVAGGGASSERDLDALNHSGTVKVSSHPLSPPISASKPPAVSNQQTAIDPTNFSADVQKDILKEFSGGGKEPWLEETLANLKTEPSRGILDEDAHPDQTGDVDEDLERELAAKLEAMSVDEELGSESSLTLPGSIDMTVQGNLALKLNYGNPGQYVMISFSNQAVRIQLSDGTEFKIPVRKKSRAA